MGMLENKIELLERKIQRLECNDKYRGQHIEELENKVRLLESIHMKELQKQKFKDEMKYIINNQKYNKKERKDLYEKIKDYSLLTKDEMWKILSDIIEDNEENG